MNLGRINWANLLDYTVQPSDMELFQTYMLNGSKERLLGERTKGLLYGGRLSVISGLQVGISAGLALMPDGQLVKFDATIVVLGTADASNPRIDRIELGYNVASNTMVVDNLSQTKTFDFLINPVFTVLAGVPAVTPAAPSPTGTRISLGFVQVNAGQAALILGNLNQTVDGGYDISALQLGDKNSFVRFNQSVSQLQFSNDGTRWQSFGSGGGGGGGGSIWEPVDGLAPTALYEYGQKAFSFETGGNQALSLSIKVPSSYLAGSPISMKALQYSPGATLNWKFQATTTLVRKSVDALTTTTNQYLSTNGDVTNSTSNQLREIIYDLTDGLGSVNGVSVSPGDLLIVQLQRVNAAGAQDVSDVRLIPSSTEVLFA